MVVGFVFQCVRTCVCVCVVSVCVRMYAFCFGVYESSCERVCGIDCLCLRPRIRAFGVMLSKEGVQIYGQINSAIK